MNRSQIDRIFWCYCYRTTRLVTAVNNSTTQQTNSTHLKPQPAHSDSFCWVQHAFPYVLLHHYSLLHYQHNNGDISLHQPRFLIQRSPLWFLFIVYFVLSCSIKLLLSLLNCVYSSIKDTNWIHTKTPKPGKTTLHA